MKGERMHAGDSPPAPFLPTSPATERYIYDPYGVVADFDQHFESLRRNMESMLLPTWSTVATRPVEGLSAPRLARADFFDKGAEFVVDLEMPGFERKDIEIELTANRVEVEAERERESEEQTEAERFFAHERAYATLHRSFTFPEEVLPEKATAKLENGVLKLHLPKREPAPVEKAFKLKVD
jgi:HSP20 family protein